MKISVDSIGVADVQVLIGYRVDDCFLLTDRADFIAGLFVVRVRMSFRIIDSLILIRQVFMTCDVNAVAEKFSKTTRLFPARDEELKVKVISTVISL